MISIRKINMPQIPYHGRKTSLIINLFFFLVTHVLHQNSCKSYFFHVNINEIYYKQLCAKSSRNKQQRSSSKEQETRGSLRKAHGSIGRI